jgi:hypothetical protein
MTDHRTAALIAIPAVMVAAIVARISRATMIAVEPIAPVVAMVTLFVATMVAAVIAALRIGRTRAPDGSGHHADRGEDHADFHGISFHAPGSQR